MEVLDFNKINSVYEIQEQINSFVKKDIMTQKQASVINIYKVYKFFKSSLGQRMLKSEFVKRKQTIYAQIKMKDVYIYEDLIKEDNTNIYGEESLMLRGIIDAYFE